MLRVIIFLMSLSFTNQAMSLYAWNSGSVTRTLVDGNNYGHCMAYIDSVSLVQANNCVLPGWVTFSCSGDYNSKSTGNTLFQSAQLAFVSNKAVVAHIDDSRKHNGYCYAYRIDVTDSSVSN